MWIAEGAPITLVQEQLSHASVVTTQRYLHPYPSQGAGLAARIDENYRAVCGLAWGRAATGPHRPVGWSPESQSDDRVN